MFTTRPVSGCTSIGYISADRGITVKKGDSGPNGMWGKTLYVIPRGHGLRPGAETYDEICDAIALAVKMNEMELYDDEADVVEHAVKNRDPEVLRSMDLKRIYKDAVDNLGLRSGKTASLGPEDFIYLCPAVVDGEKQTDGIFLSGQKGAGKTTVVAEYGTEYKMRYPDNKVFLISEKAADTAFDTLLPERLHLDDVASFDIDNNYEKLRNSLVIFDDIEAISDKRVKTAVYALKNKLYRVGRAAGITVVSAVHKLHGGYDTKADFTDSSHLVVFPMWDSGDARRYLKEQHVDPKVVDEIFKLSSRWICHYKRNPNMIIHQHGAFIL